VSSADDRSWELAGRASQGDEGAVHDLLQLHLPRLRAYLRLQMGPELRAKESISDLAQSTCREVLQHADRFRFGGEQGFRYWLFTTASRKVKNRLEYYRAGKRDIAREASPPVAAGDEDALAALYQTLSTPSRDLMRREQMEGLEAAMDSLSEDHREVILLSRILGLAHEEIAESMGRSVSATRSLLHRALAELAERLHPSWGGDDRRS
jgi:RNA polymerase sigma-70 factor (ECF subfamily)